jgi:deoxyhypusine synthase
MTFLLSYFCQISDSTTSYGSGAVPNEKITWEIRYETPKFIIESDATVAPLILLIY